MRDLPLPVGVVTMTLLPDRISMSASSWCGYSVSPSRCAQAVNVS